MKKNYYSLFAAATMLLAATSCSQEEDFAQSSGDMTSFEISLEGASQSRAAGDGLTATKLYYEVYQGEKKVIDETADLVEGKKTVNLPLLRGEKYDIMFWAQAPEGSIYDADDLKNIAVTYEGATANNEKNDAFFYGEQDFKATSNVTKIELRRPFAQLNVGTTEDDWNTAINHIDDTNKPVTSSKVVVTNLATKFNVLNGEASEAQEEVTFVKTELLKDENGTYTEQFTAKEGAIYRNLAMNYLLVPGMVTDETPEVKSNTNVTATFWRGEQELFTIDNLVNIPIQRNYRTNILGNLLADSKTFEIEVVPGFDGDYEEFLGTVNTNEELEALLKQDKESIVIDLAVSESRATETKTYTVNIGAWTEKYYFGSANTKSITINANGNTICFNHENTDWNYIRCVNDDAKWIINDAHLTNSGNNDGPWNRHDIRFYNAVELNNVTSDKAIALLNDGKLTNVKISDVHPDNSEAYGLWITTQGQTVDIDGLEIVAHESKTGDRGIKIDNQYVDESAKVTLNVKDAKFVTQKKAAITVKSEAGADINLENLDLTGVKADNFVAVWVDKDCSDYFDLVTVNGGFKKLEGEDSDIFKDNATINLPAGTYTLPSMKEYEGITIIGTEGTVIGGDNATTGFGSNFGKNTTIKNVSFIGKTNGVRYSYANGGKSTFENCTFAGESTYGFHIDSSNAAEFEFKNCTFSGFNAFAGDLVKVTFNNCTFKNNGNYGHTNIWSNGYFNNCIWEDKTSVGTRGDNAHLYFNEVEESYHHEYIGSAESLFAFAATVNSTEKPDSWENQTIILVDDIDLQNQAWTPIGACDSETHFKGTFDGNGKTIYNLNVDKSEDTYAYSTSGLFGWIDQSGATIKNVKVTNAIVKGSHYTGVIAGYATGRIVNCIVTNATVEGYNLNEEANGDKIGGIVGYLNEHSYLNGNTIDNSTISGNRDLGGIAGAVAKSTKEMKNNTVSNVTITYSTPKATYASAGIFVSGRTGYVADESNTSSNVTINCVVTNAEDLAVALANSEISTIYLGNGEFGTIVAKSNKTIIGTEYAKVDAINLNGAANLTLKNITFDATKAIAGSSKKKDVVIKANIVTGTTTDNPGIGARNLVINGCNFNGTFADGGAAIAFTDQARTSGASGNITITNCTFSTVGGYYDIYGYYTGNGYFKIENNTFGSESEDFLPIYLGRYQSNDAVVVKGNGFKNVTSFEGAAYIKAHSDSYTVSFVESDNSFAVGE